MTAPTPGQAAADEAETLSEHVSVRFPADMIAVAKHLAAAEGMTASAWIRREVEREAARRAAAREPQAAPGSVGAADVLPGSAVVLRAGPDDVLVLAVAPGTDPARAAEVARALGAESGLKVAIAPDAAAIGTWQPDAPAGTGAAPSCPDPSQHRDVYGNPLPLAGTGAEPELAAAMRQLSADMHAEADASGDDAKAAALHEYASRIRLALGPAAALESLEGK